MDYMKAQKLICDSAGHILSGSASIVVPVYDPSAGFRTKKVSESAWARYFSFVMTKKRVFFCLLLEDWLNTTHPLMSSGC